MPPAPTNGVHHLNSTPVPPAVPDVVAEHGTPAKSGPAASASSAAQSAAEVLLERADKLLKESVSPVFEHARVIKHAIGGPEQKSEMRRAMGEAYDAEVREVWSEAAFLCNAISGDTGAIKQVSEAIKPLQNKAANLFPEKVEEEEVRVWTWTSGGYTLASILLLGLGINSTATIALGSGVPGFDSPLRAYLFTFLPAGIAIAFAGVGRWLSDVGQLALMRWLFGLGVAFAVMWVFLFAQCFSSFVQQPPEFVLSPVPEGAVPTSPISTLSGPLFIICSVLAEAFLGAGCALAALRSRHLTKARKMVHDPEHDQLKASISALAVLKARLETAAARLGARIEKIEANKQDYLNRATECFAGSVTQR